MSDPLISIIVPVYNVEKYVAICLESLINQTFRDIEIICVNDGSPDSSLLICEQYAKKDSRIIVLSQNNQGLSAARNTGLSRARGKYVQFCDSDDYYALTMCEKMYGVMESSGADLAVCGAEVICDQAESVISDQEYFSIKFKGLCPVNIDAIRETNVPSWNKIFKKTIIDRYKIQYPVGLIYEDVCFFFKYMFVSKTIFCIPECLYVYLRRDGSIMSNRFKKTPRALDHVNILKDMKDFMVEHNLRSNYEINVFLWIIITYTQCVFRFGVESVFAPAVAIVSELLRDVPDDFIKNCPYVSGSDKQKLAALKLNDAAMFLRHEKLKDFFSVIFPPQTKRRSFAKKIYKRLRRKLIDE